MVTFLLDDSFLPKCRSSFLLEDDEENTARLRKGLPSRRKFYDIVMQAVRESRDRKRDQVMQALLDEFQYLIQRRGYELAAPGVFEELARALNEFFKQRHEGRLSRITRRMSYAPQLSSRTLSQCR